MEMKWMCHPELPGQEIEVPAVSVDHYGHSGWLLMDGPPARDEENEVARATVRGEPYDSGEPADAKSNESPAKSSDSDSTKSGDSADNDDDDESGTTKRTTRRASSPKKEGDK